VTLLVDEAGSLKRRRASQVAGFAAVMIAAAAFIGGWALLPLLSSWGRPVSHQLVSSIEVPVQVDGENRRALVRSPDRHLLASLLPADELPPAWQAVVSAIAHHIIARSGQEDVLIGTELPQAQWHRAAPGGFEFADSEGRPSLEAYALSDLTSWETLVWEPEEAHTLPWTITLPALLAFTLVTGLALWLGARRQVAEQDLKASKDRLQLAFDATQLGWLQYDPIRRTVRGDVRANEIFDAGADEMALEEFVRRVHRDDMERVHAAFEVALDPANPKPLAIEYRFRRRDGTVRWVENHGLAYFQGVGRARLAVSVVGTVQDITERKESDEKERLLMEEINHRAKNILSVVHAIAHQTATRDPERFVERFSERIQALSANQDLLVRNEWNGVEIADLVPAQLAHFAGIIGSRIVMHGPQLRLKAASAQAIGLALHELATNAGKYGALSTYNGRVDIGWGTEGDTFTISWTESNGPPVSAPKRRGFGTIVIEAMAARSVGGTVQLDYAPSGLTWRLMCPAANALEPGWGAASNFHPDSPASTDAPA
jgi:PAS domain S-box-containing protein